MSHPLDAADLRARVHKALAEFLGAQLPDLEAIAPDLDVVGATLTDFLLGSGKRLRPAFCYWGWRGAGGVDAEAIVRAAAALELVHACALIHDDVMDGSATRRGRPSVHETFAHLHDAEGWLGDRVTFGRGVAILLGDLCLVWADRMLHASGLPADVLERGRPVFDRMRVELMAGQYLDVIEQSLAGGAPDAVERAMRVARYKSAKYTVERPLHLGAALAGASAATSATYTSYGIPLGEAFQLRDDVLGVFGNPAETGKPAGDDLREGKRTVLVATANDRATREQRAQLGQLVGNPDLDADGIATLQAVIRDSGALDHVESLISDLTAQATDALAVGTIDADAREILAKLATAATARTR